MGATACLLLLIAGSVVAVRWARRDVFRPPGLHVPGDPLRLRADR